MSFLEIAKNRQSCRSYDANRPVEDEKIMAVAKAACAENDTLHNMPFAVTPESVAAAIKAADAYGRYFTEE